MIEILFKRVLNKPRLFRQNLISKKKKISSNQIQFNPSLLLKNLSRLNLNIQKLWIIVWIVNLNQLKYKEWIHLLVHNIWEVKWKMIQI